MVKAVRDLGGTINTTGRGYAKVIDGRISNAISSLRRFRHLPHEHAVKAQFIKGKILATALYGIECAEPSGHMMQKLQSGIANAMGSSSARACNSMTYELHNYNGDLDPHIHQPDTGCIV